MFRTIFTQFLREATTTKTGIENVDYGIKTTYQEFLESKDPLKTAHYIFKKILSNFATYFYLEVEKKKCIKNLIHCIMANIGSLLMFF